MIMIKNVINRVRSAFVSPDVVAAYESAIPRYIHVSFKKDGDYYIGFVDEINDDSIKGLLITQGSTQDELISNINQLVYSYIRMPEQIRPFYGNRFKPEVNSSLSSKKSGELTLAKA